MCGHHGLLFESSVSAGWRTIPGPRFPYPSPARAGWHAVVQVDRLYRPKFARALWSRRAMASAMKRLGPSFASAGSSARRSVAAWGVKLLSQLAIERRAIAGARRSLRRSPAPESRERSGRPAADLPAPSPPRERKHIGRARARRAGHRVHQVSSSTIRPRPPRSAARAPGHAAGPRRRVRHRDGDARPIAAGVLGMARISRGGAQRLGTEAATSGRP